MSQTSIWPVYHYDDCIATTYLIHLCSQIVGKLKLLSPFEPQWANVILFVTTRGLTSGLIPYKDGAFSIDFDFFEHQVIIATNKGQVRTFKLTSMSVAEFYNTLFKFLNELDIQIKIDVKPIEIPHDIIFPEDTAKRPYEPQIARAWWQILFNTQLVMERYHAKFKGKTQPIGLMWGHLDLRDVRYNGKFIKPVAPFDNYLFRNSLDEAQIMCGFWHGNEQYPRAAYYSYTYPKPTGIEQAKIQPEAAYWNKEIQEFILDYQELQKMKNPAEALLNFFESTYQAGAELANWDKSLNSSGRPV